MNRLQICSPVVASICVNEYLFVLFDVSAVCAIFLNPSFWLERLVSFAYKQHSPLHYLIKNLSFRMEQSEMRNLLCLHGLSAGSKCERNNRVHSTVACL
jgi:hypothetical protein